VVALIGLLQGIEDRWSLSARNVFCEQGVFICCTFVH
jgi:hypothetical protein